MPRPARGRLLRGRCWELRAREQSGAACAATSGECPLRGLKRPWLCLPTQLPLHRERGSWSPTQLGQWMPSVCWLAGCLGASEVTSRRKNGGKRRLGCQQLLTSIEPSAAGCGGGAQAFPFLWHLSWREGPILRMRKRSPPNQEEAELEASGVILTAEPPSLEWGCRRPAPARLAVVGSRRSPA